VDVQFLLFCFFKMQANRYVRNIIQYISNLTTPPSSSVRFLASKSVKTTHIENKMENPFKDSARPMLKFKEMLSDINTDLTAEQAAAVEELKKKYIHGPSGKRSMYRDVPTLDEQDSIPDSLQYRPYIPDNAQDLIDWALSHVPPRKGKRGSRRAKRMAQKWEAKRKNDAWRKEGERRSLERKHEKAKRQNEMAAMYRQMAREIQKAKEQSLTQMKTQKEE